MAFDFVIFATALYALTTETIEDAFVLMIFQISFGKKSVIYGLVAAAITAASVLILLAVFGIPKIEPYSIYVKSGSGLFLVALGIFWIIKFVLVRKGVLKEESESGHGTATKSVAVFTLVFVEMLEILAILIPFVLSNYVVETSLSIAVSIAVSIILMVMIGGRLRGRLENKLSRIKLLAGAALIISGIVIIVNLK